MQTNENYIVAQEWARQHAKKTGHKVIVDLGYWCEYGPAKPKEKK